MYLYGVAYYTDCEFKTSVINFYHEEEFTEEQLLGMVEIAIKAVGAVELELNKDSEPEEYKHLDRDTNHEIMLEYLSKGYGFTINLKDYDRLITMFKYPPDDLDLTKVDKKYVITKSELLARIRNGEGRKYMPVTEDTKLYEAITYRIFY